MSETNLFSPEYTTGNLAEISFMTRIVGRISVIIISMVGFGIVISSIVTNALHALYAVSPKFWDRVDEAKRASLGISGAEGGNQIVKIMGAIQIFLLNLLPNIKAMTKFDDEPMDVKAYFMKAIPLMCLQIFVGVFVFFSYPAALAEKFSDFGRGLFDVVLTNVDPTAWVEALPSKMLILDLSTDGGLSDDDKAINKITKSVYKTYVGELSDMTKEKRATVSKQIEQWVIDNTTSYTAFTDSDKYTMRVASRISVSEPDLSRANGEKNGVHTFAFATEVDTWSHGSTKSTTNLWVRYDLVFTPKAQKGNSEAIDCSMAVGPSTAETSGKNKVISLSAAGSSYAMLALNNKASGEVSVDNKTVKVYLSVSNSNVITIKPQVSTKSLKNKAGKYVTEVTNIGGLYYKYGTGKHPVRSISWTKTMTKGEATFSAISTDLGISDWAWGSSPTASSTDSTSSKSTTTTTNSDGVMGGN